MSECMVCGRDGYESDLAWHIRQEHVVPHLERPENGDEKVRGMISIIREMSRYLVASPVPDFSEQNTKRWPITKDDLSEGK